MLDAEGGRIAYRLHARDLRLVMNRQRARPPCGFACSLMDSRRELLTDLTTCSRPNRGSPAYPPGAPAHSAVAWAIRS